MPKTWAQLQVVFSPDNDSAEIRFEGPQKHGQIGIERGSLDHYVEPIVTAHGKPVVSVGVNANGEMTRLKIHEGAGAFLTPYLRGLFDSEETV
jgi:hypothetical protein